MSESIFLDASFWIALRDKRETQYAQARAVLARLAQRRAMLVTTLLVAAEAHAYFSRSVLRHFLLADLRDNPAIRLEPVQFEDQTAALSLLQKHKDKEYSLCDAVSFCVMDRMGISRALSFDNHFSQIGLFQIIDRPELI